MFDQVKTYSWDLPLFKELGLEPFDLKCRQKHFVGKVMVGESEVNIWVEGLPAQFYEFKILCRGVDPKRRYHVTTGSGCLMDFWAAIKMLAEDMLVVDEIEWQEEDEGG